jgi:hypothetical protein
MTTKSDYEYSAFIYGIQEETETRPDRHFVVGDKVHKVKGYSWPGVVVSAFQTLSGKHRYVVECTTPGTVWRAGFKAIGAPTVDRPATRPKPIPTALSASAFVSCRSSAPPPSAQQGNRSERRTGTRQGCGSPAHPAFAQERLAASRGERGHQRTGVRQGGSHDQVGQSVLARTRREAWRVRLPHVLRCPV